MTVIRFKKKLDCTDAEKCFDNFSKQVSGLVPSFIDGISGHITILHSLPYHEIFCTFYDKGEHENWSQGKIISTKFNDTQTKFKGSIPTKTELENL